MNDSQGNAPEQFNPPGGLIPAGGAVPAAHSISRSPAYPDEAVEPAPPFHLNLLEYWRILNKRKWIIASVAAAFLVLGAVQTLMTTPLYTASVRLQIDRNVAKIIEGGAVTPIEGSDLEFLRTQYELLQSRALAERVASTLKLGEDADFVTPKGSFFSRLFGNSGRKDKADLERAAAAIVVANRTVRPVSGSRLVDISYSDPSPVRAQRITSAYAEAFIASNLRQAIRGECLCKNLPRRSDQAT